MHFYLFTNHKKNKDPIIIHKVKELDLENWISNYEINFIDYVNLNLNGPMFSKLIDYDNYTPALLIDKIKNNSELTSNSTHLSLNLKFKQINFREFISYSCDRSLEDQQLNQICFDQSSKLSINFFLYFLLLSQRGGNTVEIKEGINFMIAMWLPHFLIVICSLDFTNSIFLNNKLDSSNLVALSINLIIFNLFRSFIFLLYELNRFSNFQNEFNSLALDYSIFNLFVIYGWISIIAVNLYKLSKIFKINMQYRIKYDKLTKKYDNVSFNLV